MDTSAISYRVVDFLKTHPPFQAIDDADLLELAARGRVRFFEANEYLVWQGEPHKSHVFVIQQGTVSLWDEAGEVPVLKDVCGAGDLLAVDRFTDAPCCLHSARSESDVVVYGFPAWDFASVLEKYPHARQFVAALGAVTSDYQWTRDARDPQTLFLKDLVGARPMEICGTRDTISEVAATMLRRGCDAIAVMDGESGPQAVVTVNDVLAWVAAGAGNAAEPMARLLRQPSPAVGPSASVADAVLAVAESGTGALVLTSDGTLRGQFQSVVTVSDLGRAFGDQPAAILREIRHAATIGELRTLNHRARALVLHELTAVASLDWLARFVALVDARILERLIAMAGGEELAACWCVVGAAGRGESLTRHAPQLLLVAEDDRERNQLLAAHERVCDALIECDYFVRTDITYDRAFLVASVEEWVGRYRYWLSDPVRSAMYLARQLFDARPMHGRTPLYHEMSARAIQAIDGDFLQVLANDCLANLPPLTFFQGAVVDSSGEHTSVFRLDESALRPLVDVGRVFGMVARRVFGTSTLERFAGARTILPEHEAVFREAAETLRILLWQQGRIGIDQGTSGSELPPTLLSRHDRHVLKSGFRSILQLVQFTGERSWFAAL